MATPTEKRDEVCRLACTDVERALALARTIDAPWFRAQALGHVVRFIDAAQGVIADEAEGAADACEDDYQRSAVRSWIIYPLARAGEFEHAQAVLDRALPIAERAVPPASSAQALALLSGAACAISTEAMRSPLEMCLTIANSHRHWRIGQAMERAIAAMSYAEPAVASELVSRVEDYRLRRRLQRVVDGEQLTPQRSF